MIKSRWLEHDIVLEYSLLNGKLSVIDNNIKHVNFYSFCSFTAQTFLPNILLLLW